MSCRCWGLLQFEHIEIYLPRECMGGAGALWIVREVFWRLTFVEMAWLNCRAIVFC